VQPIETLTYLKWPDILDILLMSFLIHRLLVLFRGTATLHVTFALALLWLLQVAAHEWNLILTSRFLEGLGTVAVLVIVVAFRDEIRDVLIQTSPTRLFLGRPTAKPEARRIHATVEAVFRMAEDHTGALLVFQNRDRLGEIIRDGIAFGGQVSVPILGSVFAKESPVHDGAAIIRGNKIERVGAILPLTRRHDLPPEYGTRHRAAIGLSEACDAAVVVVSEERGEVSLIHRGEVSQPHSPAALEQSLRRLLGWDADGQHSRIVRREFFRQVAGFFLTALAVTAYWGVYYGKQISVTTLDVKIEFRNIPPGLELGSTSVEEVVVQVRGKRPLIEDLKLRPEQLGASVDLESQGPGEGQVIQLDNSNVEGPVGLEVVRIEPSSLIINLDRRVQKQVPVRPEFAQPLPEGYQAAVAPQSIRLVGPDSVLKYVEAAATQPITFNARLAETGEMTMTVEVARPTNSVRIAEGQPRQVRVTIRRPAPMPNPDDAPLPGEVENPPAPPAEQP
jgi:diadenylate cyclase